jgi:hypothetical protein
MTNRITRPIGLMCASTIALTLMLVAPGAAHAGNGLHPRTPVVWTGAPCMTIVDRTGGNLFPLVYEIPYEDTGVTPDEVPNSRTHQFFAFCRDHHPDDIIPSWITEADLADADAHGLGDAGSIDPDLYVLEVSSDWAGCWTRINADADRRPITFAAAAEPVSWDTMTLPAGAWVVEGYTYEPWSNAWWPHPGVFKIIDDPDPAATGPAAALTFAEQPIEFGQSATISGCVDAMPGTTMTASWAISGFGQQLDWQVIEADIPAESGTFEFPYTPAMETISNTVLIKIDVSDPMGRTWTAYGDNYISVTEDFGDDECGAVFVGCDTGDESSDTTGGDSGTGAGDSSGSDTGLGPAAVPTGGGCSCSTNTGDINEPNHDRDRAWALLVFALLGFRSRSRLSSKRAGSDPSARG